MKEILYSKSEAVAALNHVEGFNPMELARTISRENQEDQLYLDVKYRKLWFRLMHPLGKIISRIVSYTENMALVEARIYLDKCDATENYIANSFSQKFRSNDPQFGDKFLEMAETAAIGRALADAGFGVQFADVGEENDPAQVDAGIPVPYPNGNVWETGEESGQGANFPKASGIPSSSQEQTPDMGQQGMMSQFFQQAQANGMAIGQPPVMQSVPNPGMAAQGRNQQQGTYAPAHPQIQRNTGSPVLDGKLPVEDLVQRMTYEQAVQTVIGGKGKDSGKTMGQVAAENPGSLSWYATQYSGGNHLIPAAARIILDQAFPKAG